MSFSAITNWQPGDDKLFDNDVFHRRHPFLDHIDVSDDGLAKLIDETPDDLIDVVTMGTDKTDNSSWRTGDVRGVSGHEAIEAVKTGRVWLNLRDLNHIMPQYKAILDGIYQQLDNNIKGLNSRRKKIGFIISSPNVQALYHIDIPSTMLWQLRGTKRVWAYPLKDPFVSQKMLEAIYLNEIDEMGIPYDPTFDDGAVVIDLKPGEALAWQHNAPHRVQNHDVLNVSLSTEHFTLESIKQYGVHFSNGYLSRHFGLGPMSSDTNGIKPWLKGAFTAGLKRSGIQKEHRREKTVSFRVDPTYPQGVRDITPYPHGAFNTVG